MVCGEPSQQPHVDADGIAGVLTVKYDACMLGGERKKHQMLLTNQSALAALAILCDSSHTHKP